MLSGRYFVRLGGRLVQSRATVFRSGSYSCACIFSLRTLVGEVRLVLDVNFVFHRAR